MAAPRARAAAQHVGAPHERGDEQRRGLLVQRVGGADLLDAAAAQHGDAVAEIEGFVLLVRDEQRRDPHPLDQRPQLPARPLTEGGIEVGQRLVEQQHPRLRGQRPGERHPLLLAAGELLHAPALEPREVNEREGVSDPRVGVGDVVQTERHVFADVQVGKQCVVLEHHAEAAARGRQACDFLALDADRSRVRRLEAGEEAQQRRLAAPRRTQQGDDLAAGNIERHRPDRHLMRPLLRHAGQGEKRHRPLPPRPRTCSSQ